MTRKRNKMIYTGGKILGSGADGCVFSAAGWPCVTPLAGYNPDDPELVTKLIPKTDNEDAIIRLAQSIIPDKLDHIIGHIGTCIPASNKDITTALSRRQFDENKNELEKVRNKYYTTTTTPKSRDNPNACERVKGYETDHGSLQMDDAQDLQNSLDVKLLINKRYDRTLYHYIRKLPNTTTDFHNIFEAFVEYVKVLERLAEGKNNKRILNVDLHSANIFVNTGADGKLTMGVADFGRCALQNGAKEYTQYIDYILYYGVSYGAAIGFPVVPFEYKMYSFMPYFKKKYSGRDATVDNFFNYFNYVLNKNESKQNITPWSIFAGNISDYFISSYFDNFIELIIDVQVKNTDPIFQEFCQLMFMDRFNSLGAMQILFYELINMNENSKQINGIMRGIYHYLMGSNTIPLQTGTEFARFVKLYFDVCLYPHKEARARAKPNKPTMTDYISVMRAAPKFSDQLLQIFVEPAALPPPPPIVYLPRVVPQAPVQKQGQAFGSPVRVAIQPTQVRLPPRRGLVAAPIATRKITPKYLTRAAVAKDPTLASRIINPLAVAKDPTLTSRFINPLAIAGTKKTRKHRR